MLYMTVDQLREAFLTFFESKGHLRLPGASLVPVGDPTLLLTAAGMVPLKPYFIGVDQPPSRRITTCQRCLRTPDIENVGITSRHATFFEMMGNFSFGDYFKEEAISWAWEFVTSVLQVDADKLWVSIHDDDDEAYGIWKDKIKVPAERIVRLSDNFWGIGVGPCGPCSEIHLDRGEAMGCGKPTCRPGCDDCERFFEIWNLVFIQYNQNEDGQFIPLEKKGIDTGMGLERVAAMLQGVESIFETDLLSPIVDFIAREAEQPLAGSQKARQFRAGTRLITDHLRAVTFMAFDDILPGNEGRGYVMRRLLRRAIRYCRLIGFDSRKLPEVAGIIAWQMQVGYPELPSRLDYIKKVIGAEEERFSETLDQGMNLFEKITAAAVKKGSKVISGEEAFRLHDTYGFPLELTEEMAGAIGMTVDREGFNQAMEDQRNRARAARTESGYLGNHLEVYGTLALPPTEFVGYEQKEAETEILAIIQDGREVKELHGEGQAELVLRATPFYAASGGQVADRGMITIDGGGRFTVDEVLSIGRGLIIHRGTYSGDWWTGAPVKAVIDVEARLAVQRNHTATHLLHKALHLKLGEHANQAGSLVAPDRLRFDFVHFSALSPEELQEIEREVNARILENRPVVTTIMPYKEAIKTGAAALFGEKYGDEVRVVSVTDYSRELCGGTHVKATGEIGLFHIVSEGSISSGVRRIEAVTGKAAHQHILEQLRLLDTAAATLQTSPKDLPAQIEKLQADLKQAQRRLLEYKESKAQSLGEDLLSRAVKIGEVRVLAAKVNDMDRKAMLSLGDKLKEKLDPCVLVLGGVAEGKVALMVMVGNAARDLGLHAAEIVKSLWGGGGGSATLAQAGGKNEAALDAALAAVVPQLTQKLGARV